VKTTAVLSNSQHPEYGQATVKFPISRYEYDGVLAKLEVMGIGGASARDCRVDSISGAPILKRLEKVAINIDELDYLAKCLDLFTAQELAQFQGTAVEMGLFDMTDLINLTFCCQQATVITDFSDWGAIGRSHLLTINGGCLSASQLEEADGEMIALELILRKKGTVTPYGVVYDNARFVP